MTRDEIKAYEVLLEQMTVLLSCFEIERFRRDKLQLYFKTIENMAKL